MKQSSQDKGNLPSPNQLHVFYHYTYGTRKRLKDGEIKTQRIPQWTHCFITDTAGRYARGSAQCSFNDNPCKAIGRKIAYKRALAGYYSQKCVPGQTPEGSTMYKVLANHPLAELEAKFLAMAQKTVDTMTPSTA